MPGIAPTEWQANAPCVQERQELHPKPKARADNNHAKKNLAHVL
jgi:hypothetical protein